MGATTQPGSAAQFAFNRADNEKGALEELLELNRYYWLHRWPADYATTTHRLIHGDARDLSSVPSSSIHLIVTSPPYWTLKEYAPNPSQLGAIAEYERFLGQLDLVWKECNRVLVPGRRICCVVGDVCIPRKKHGRHP